MSYDKIIKASMCSKGENMFKIKIKEGEKSLKKLSYVKDSRIKRNLPDEIIIEIDERREIAALSNSGSVVYIDEEGYILSVEEKKEEILLPQIFGLEQVDIKVGINLFREADIGNIEEFIVYSDKLKLLELMKYINLTDEKNIMIELNNGTKVAFGPLNNVKYKLSFLNKILEDINNKDINAKQILFNKGQNPIIVRDNR